MTHKIPIKQGEEPVKIRPIPISGPKLAVLQASSSKPTGSRGDRKRKPKLRMGQPCHSPSPKKGGDESRANKLMENSLRLPSTKCKVTEINMDTTKRERNIR